ncbi:transcription factor S-II, central domain-containing protein [Dipodascopsis tothii]|uniref:transcription factor S-II, central domain-containing protein n=1 Tax=Dipodascopsis tothii TaxID=44089 RepID=UPI0034CDC002
MARAQSASAIRRKSNARSVKTASPPVAAMSVESVRKKCQEAMYTALIAETTGTGVTTSQVQSLSQKIEDEIYKACADSVGADYKTSMRSRLVNIKDKKNDLKDRLLDGRVTPAEFARMSTEQMSTVERRKEDEALRQQALRQSIVQQVTVESILDLKEKDGRTREKWGVSSSAAAVDSF